MPLFFGTGVMPLPNAPGNFYSGSRGVPNDVPETILRIDHYFTGKLSLRGVALMLDKPSKI